jgi:hypothetical protein
VVPSNHVGLSRCQGIDVSQDPFYTVAFPEVAAHDLRWIQLLRQKYDPNFALVDPHTMVFGISDLSEGVYLHQVVPQARAALHSSHQNCCHDRLCARADAVR